MMFEIRMAQQHDLAALAAIEAVCFPAEEAADYDTFVKRYRSFPEQFLVAVCKEQVIGFINGCITNQKTISDEMFEDSSLHKPDGNYQAIFGLDVHPDYQRRGAARMLMEAMIAQTRRDNKKGLILTCKQQLIPYYESFGYRNMGLSDSQHGGAVWYDMILEFEYEKESTRKPMEKTR